VVKLLLDNRAGIYMQDKNGATALYLASASDKVEVVDLLLKEQAKTDCKSP
jgi:ankyrin repeat protein